MVKLVIKFGLVTWVTGWTRQKPSSRTDIQSLSS